MNNAINVEIVTHQATLNGATVLFSAENYDTVIPAFVAKHGPGIPAISPLSVDATLPAVVETVEASVSVEAPVPPSSPVVERSRSNPQIDAAGLARSEAALLAARAAGFSPKETVYARGSMVVEDGVENARLSRQEWEKRPAIRDAAVDFCARIRDERREDLELRPSDVRMASSGRLVRMDPKDGVRRDVDLTKGAFRSLVARMGLPGGSGPYLETCWPELRASNINQWAKALATADAKAARANDDSATNAPFQIRTRQRADSDRREAYAVVGSRYAAFDVDKVVRALAENVDSSARAEIVYDGRRVMATAIFHSDVQPEHYVAGEFFKAGIIVKSADDGSSSIKISTVLFQNLCLNLIILDECEVDIARIIHSGCTEKIGARVRQAVKTARERIGYFVKQWDLAVEDDVKAAVQAESADLLPVSVALRGLFNGLIERDLVPLKRRDRTNVLNRLEASFLEDRSAAGLHESGTITRAGVVNALTRYAHASGDLDAFDGYDLEVAASRLLRTSDPLPYVEEVTVA